jgi:alkylhydroperoxidase/carboxymuconolactone decarboxylase family protein YurZ
LECESGGEGGIRTPGTGFSQYNGLANRSIQPLCHLSAEWFQQFSTVLEQCSVRQELSKRDRSLITVAALIALNRPEQLRFHLAKAVENGVKQEELIEAITHLAFYSGWPDAMTAVTLAKELFEKPGNQ